jgi:hypothetical protein
MNIMNIEYLLPHKCLEEYYTSKLDDNFSVAVYNRYVALLAESLDFDLFSGLKRSI